MLADSRMAEPHRIVRAWLESPSSGIIELDRDWSGDEHPRFTLGKHCPTPGALRPRPGLPAGARTAIFSTAAAAKSPSCCRWSTAVTSIRRATRFIWRAISTTGRRGRASRSGRCSRPSSKASGCCSGAETPRAFSGWGQRFKFVTGEHQWLLPPDDAPNAVRDEHGNINRVLDPTRTGWHLWRFTVASR